MQNHAADQLHVEVPHVERAAAGLADHGEGFGQDLIQDFLQRAVALGGTPAAAILVLGFGLELHPAEALLDALAKLVGLGAQFGVAEALHLRLERANARDQRPQALDLTLIPGAEYFGENRV